ncbi:MAG: HEPN domain-containing protein [Deltaproteobacteria bacterium]|nr:HEPN domain-containing protein [Deltaproteobacteria bacterium]
MSRDEILSLIQRARRSLRSARNLLEDGDHDFAMSRAYYAMFYAATAALLSRNITRAKHSGVIGAFGQHLVKAGTFTPAHQRMLQAAFSDRTAGDYAGVFPTRDDVERRIEEATQFVGAVEQFLRNEGISAG